MTFFALNSCSFLILVILFSPTAWTENLNWPNLISRSEQVKFARKWFHPSSNLKRAFLCVPRCIYANGKNTKKHCLSSATEVAEEWAPIVHSVYNAVKKQIEGHFTLKRADFKKPALIKTSRSGGLRNKDVNFIIPFKMLSLFCLFFLLWSVEVITFCFGVEGSDFKELLIVWLHVETSSVHYVAFYSSPPDCCTCCHFLKCLKCFLLTLKKSFYFFFSCVHVLQLFLCCKALSFFIFRSSVLVKCVTLGGVELHRM